MAEATMPGLSPPRDELDGVAQLRLMLVDDHEVVRAGLSAALGGDPGVSVVASVGNAAEAIERARRERPDVAIVDMRLPDLSGPLLCRRLRAALPAMSVVMLSSYLSEDAVREAMEAGAAAYVTKAAGLAELRHALTEAMAGPGHRDGVSQIVRRMRQLVRERQADEDAPTPQQTRVLELMARGLTYSEIAERLVISESTVRFHVQRLKLKLGTSSRTELVVCAVRAGYLTLPEDEATSGDEAGR
jgi:DNA-binding NarL/FixJ family response regulator